jgi:hypothetical protein
VIAPGIPIASPPPRHRADQGRPIGRGESPTQVARRITRETLVALTTSEQ